MEAQLAHLATLSSKDQSGGYLNLLADILSPSNTPSLSRNVHTLVDHVTQDNINIVVGRPVLAELVKVLEEKKILDRDLRKTIVEDCLNIIQPRLTRFEEQATSLRFQLAELLEEEEDFSGAAHVLMAIPLEGGNRNAPEEEKLKTYIRIVRLLLEEEDSVQAETYYNRAALLIHSTQDKELQLAFKLCQARIHDYARRFLEAANRYHELSWVGDLDEDDRTQALSAAITCAVLAPAGPNRSRMLASLCRDERTSQLPNYNILTKMFRDHILRADEVKQFEETLKPHQLAKIAQSSSDKLSAAASADDSVSTDPDASTRTGPSTVLDRAVMEHNLLSCSKIYNNITFSGLGTLLDLTPGAAETMARKMIEQGRLRGMIDQIERLIWFESGSEEDDAQGKAGGLGDVDMHTEDTGAPYTKQWDRQIRMTAAEVESIVQYLSEKGFVDQSVLLKA
ncbi:hypothetical protein M422DRAFT_149203 [Sphaerobolus stellatus SS14]|nr:hypothetical protein M422DRAFT_149203 [Sphaerobolus stellatus SS14]